MYDDYSSTTMDRAIFNMGLSVETVSAYILCCHLADLGQPITLENLSPVWNGENLQLKNCLAELEQQNIIEWYSEPLRTGYCIKGSEQWGR